MKVTAGVTTSLPGGRSSNSIARRFADDPEFTITPYSFPNRAAILSSNSQTCSPRP